MLVSMWGNTYAHTQLEYKRQQFVAGNLAMFIKTAHNIYSTIHCKETIP